MNMKIFATILVVFLLTAGAFAASGQTADGNTRVELVYMTDVGDSNLVADTNYIIDFAGDELTPGPFITTDGNRVVVGVFFTEFELVNYKLFITLISPRCYINNITNAIEFNVFSQGGTPITDMNYYLNGNPGLSLAGFCFGNPSNQTCQRIDPNIIPNVSNVVTVFASNSMNVTSVSCDFNYTPGGGGGKSIIIIPKPDWFMFLALIFIIGGFLLFIVYSRRRQ